MRPADHRAAGGIAVWWLADPLDIHRVSDRLSSVYVERCHVDRDDNAVVIVNRERTVKAPAAFVATLLLGPGTRITHAAVRLLADSGTTVCWVGEHGVRMYASGLGPSRGSDVLMRQAYLVTRTSERLGVARAMYARRFPGEDVSKATMQQLRGREGARMKRLYRSESQRTGVPWTGRQYKAGEAFAVGDDVNRLLSAANASLYAVCHAAISGVGASPALGFVHTGGATSFVLDIADLYKAELTIPLAFDLAAKGQVDEGDARRALRQRFADGRFMKRVVRDVLELLAVPEGEDADGSDRLELWDELDGAVDGGVNWASVTGDDVEEGRYVEFSGPPIPEVPPQW